MKLLLLTTFVAIFVCHVNGGKTQRMLAALNGGMMAGMNGGMMAGMNGGMMAGMNGGMANGVIPGMMVGSPNQPMVAGGGAGFYGQPQFIPGLPAFAVLAPIPNAPPVPAVNVLPFMGFPQMAPMNLPQQPLAGITGGAMQQQLPLQADPLRRLKRQIMKQHSTFKTSMNTEIPVPTETMTTPRDEERWHEDH